jgi:hypothetical protein
MPHFPNIYLLLVKWGMVHKAFIVKIEKKISWTQVPVVFLDGTTKSIFILRKHFFYRD